MTTGQLHDSPARAYLEGIRRDTIDLHHLEHAVRKTKERTWPQGVESMEEWTAPMRKWLREAVDAAARAVWGEDGRGGVNGYMDPRTAQILHLRYLDALSWRQVATAAGLSPSRCRVIAYRGAALMDEHAEGQPWGR